MPAKDPVAIEASFRAIAATVSLAELMGRRCKRLRESWCAARFAIGFSRLVHPALVEIAEEDEQREFDFHLAIDDTPYPFQIAELFDHGRRRESEYRDNTVAELEAIFRSRPYLDIDDAAKQVKTLLLNKIEKYRYGTADLHLLMYLNLNVRSANWVTIANACEQELKQFASVWLLTELTFCCLNQGMSWRAPTGWKSIDAGS
jgi:hypothetical protein